MGRLENRVRKLEEKVERGGYAAAFSQATDEDIFALAVTPPGMPSRRTRHASRGRPSRARRSRRRGGY